MRHASYLRTHARTRPCLHPDWVVEEGGAVADAGIEDRSTIELDRASPTPYVRRCMPRLGRVDLGEEARDTCMLPIDFRREIC